MIKSRFVFVFEIFAFVFFILLMYDNGYHNIILLVMRRVVVEEVCKLGWKERISF